MHAVHLRSEEARRIRSCCTQMGATRTGAIGTALRLTEQLVAREAPFGEMGTTGDSRARGESYFGKKRLDRIESLRSIWRCRLELAWDRTKSCRPSAPVAWAN
jgi:hypothetical protein